MSSALEPARVPGHSREGHISRSKKRSTQKKKAMTSKCIAACCAIWQEKKSVKILERVHQRAPVQSDDLSSIAINRSCQKSEDSDPSNQMMRRRRGNLILSVVYINTRRDNRSVLVEHVVCEEHHFSFSLEKRRRRRSYVHTYTYLFSQLLFSLSLSVISFINKRRNCRSLSNKQQRSSNNVDDRKRREEKNALHSDTHGQRGKS